MQDTDLDAFKLVAQHWDKGIWLGLLGAIGFLVRLVLFYRGKSAEISHTEGINEDANQKRDHDNKDYKEKKLIELLDEQDKRFDAAEKRSKGWLDELNVKYRVAISEGEAVQLKLAESLKKTVDLEVRNQSLAAQLLQRDELLKIRDAKIAEQASLLRENEADILALQAKMQVKTDAAKKVEGEV